MSDSSSSSCPDFPPLPANIEGDYRLEDFLGEGANGEVYKVRQKPTNRCFAVKFARRSTPDEEETVDNEVRMLRRAAHISILRLHAYHQDMSLERAWLFTEYCPGGDLSSKIGSYSNTRSSMPESEIWVCTTEILRALNWLHDPNTTGGSIAHRDVKPSNILIDSRGRLKLADLGSATLLGASGLTRGYEGTIEYMSPEILRNESYGVSTDLWSFAVTLYEMIMSDVPFAEDVAKKGYRNPFIPPVIRYAHSIPLKELIRTLFTTIPSKRPSAQHILQNCYPCYQAGVDMDIKDNMARLKAMEARHAISELNNLAIVQEARDIQVKNNELYAAASELYETGMSMVALAEERYEEAEYLEGAVKRFTEVVRSISKPAKRPRSPSSEPDMAPAPKKPMLQNLWDVASGWC